MKKLLVLGVLATIPLVTAASAQEPAAPTPQRGVSDQPTMGPETDGSAYYSRQLRRHDAAPAVRLKAEFRAQQRMRRLAAMKWFGMSNSRPAATATPWASLYSPAWVSNTQRPFSWSGCGQTLVITRTDTVVQR